jgi:hypothetical protein
MTATTEFPLLAASDGPIQKNTIRRIGTIQFLHSTHGYMHELRTFQGGIATAQSFPRCPRTAARSAFSSVSSVTPIQSMYESSRHVTCSASAGDDVPEAEKYLLSILIAVMSRNYSDDNRGPWSTFIGLSPRASTQLCSLLSLVHYK